MENIIYIGNHRNDFKNGKINDCVEYCSQKEILSLDTETDSLNARTAILHMLQIGDEHTQFVIDCRVVDISPLKDIIQSRNIIKVLVNAKYDCTVLKNNLNWDLEAVRDCMIQEMCIYTGIKQEKGFYSLKSLAKRYNLFDYDQSDLSKDIRLGFGHNKEFTKDQIRYGALDVRLPIQIDKLQRANNPTMLNLFDLEGEFTTVLSDCEYNGIPFNVQDWRTLALANVSYKEECKSNLDFISAEYTDEEVNWNSPKQVVEVFKLAGIDTRVLDKSKSTKEKKIYKHSVSRDIISKFKGHALADAYIEYKLVAKEVSTYGLSFIDKYYIDGKIYPNYFQILNTGRTSSNSPNCQNIPNRGRNDDAYRRCFNVTEGKNFVVGDYSQQELRILAQYSQEPNMISEFNKLDSDIHSATARIMYNITGEVPKELRSKAKNTNFLMSYGGGAKALSEKYGVSLDEAQKVIDLYFSKFPKLKKYFETCHKQVLRDGYVLIDNILGRRSYIKDFNTYSECKELIDYKKSINRSSEISRSIWKKFFTIKGGCERASQNFPIQGTAASMIKLAGIRFRRWIIDNNLRDKVEINALIHDEWVIVCDSTVSKIVKNNLKRCMEESGKVFCKDVTMTAKVAVNDHWTH